MFAALVGDGDVDGGQVYSFRTPKRSNRAAQMAARSIQKNTKPEAGEEQWEDVVDTLIAHTESELLLFK